MFETISLYCERTSQAFWAEPLNALSNIGFLLAAVVASDSAKKCGNVRPHIAIAIFLVFLIGVGSFFFHTYANNFTQMTDVIPIWVFVIYLIVLMLHDFLGITWLRASLIIGVIFVILILILFGLSQFGIENYTSIAPPKTLNGSLQYFPAVAALYTFAIVLFMGGHSARGWVGAAACIFTVSLYFRTIDFTVCAEFPSGTHFIWHILNAATLWLLLESVIRHKRPSLSNLNK